MNYIIETDRMYLRELELSDAEKLGEILKDPESMKYYPRPFTEEEVLKWINWNIENYRKYKHGLWAVILKEGNIFIGDCGITMQNIEGLLLPEIGYRINKNFCKKGYATEAAKACMKYAFNKFKYDKIVSYTDKENIPSMKVMKKNGLKFVKYFEKVAMGKTVIEVLYSINKKEFMLKET